VAIGFVIGIGIGYFMFLIGKPRWLVMIFGGHSKRNKTWIGSVHS